MSVLIKGMDMPKLKPNTRVKAEIRLLDGRLEFGIMTGGYRCCEQWQYYQIAEVPTPHSDLIDRNVLLALYENLDDLDISAFKISVSMVRQNILDAPTVIEAEE